MAENCARLQPLWDLKGEDTMHVSKEQPIAIKKPSGNYKASYLQAFRKKERLLSGRRSMVLGQEAN